MLYVFLYTVHVYVPHKVLSCIVLATACWKFTKFVFMTNFVVNSADCLHTFVDNYVQHINAFNPLVHKYNRTQCVQGIIIICTYTVHVSTKLVLKAPSFITCTPAHQAHKSFLKPSRLPGEYTCTAQVQPYIHVHVHVHVGLIKHNNQLCPRRYQFTPGWREAIMVKCLAQRNKLHSCGQDSNPNSAERPPGSHVALVHTFSSI